MLINSTSTGKSVNIGFGNFVPAKRIVAIVGPQSAPVKRMIKEASQRAGLIDATFGRRARSAIIMDSSHVVLSAVQPEALARRMRKGR